MLCDTENTGWCHTDNIYYPDFSFKTFYENYGSFYFVWLIHHSGETEFPNTGNGIYILVSLLKWLLRILKAFSLFAIE